MKMLGIDYGRKKSGIAVGDSDTGMAEPFKTIVSNNLKFLIPRQARDKFFNFQSIINDQNIEKIVIGLTGGRMDSEIRAFGKRLNKETGVRVEYFDETLTTQDAQRVLIESGRSRKKRKEREDAVAAAIMLQCYLETHIL